MKPEHWWFIAGCVFWTLLFLPALYGLWQLPHESAFGLGVLAMLPPFLAMMYEESVHDFLWRVATDE